MDDRRSSERRAVSLLLWSGLLVLVLIGIAAAFGRTISVATNGASHDWLRPSMPETWLHAADLLDSWFASFPTLTLLHVVPGAVYFALVPFQFSTRLRTRHPRLHRRAGRVAVLAAFNVGVAGLVLGVLFPYGGPLAAAAVFTFGALFLAALTLALVAIRRGDAARHREWMIRAFSIGAGISTVRIVSFILLIITDANPIELAAVSFWTGFILNFAAGETWIRYTRPRPLVVRDVPVSAAGV